MDKTQIFTTAIENSSAITFKIAAFYTNTREDREDLMQEIIYQLWKSYDGFQQRAAFSTWLYRVAMNTAINHRKVLKKKIATVPVNDHLQVEQETGDKSYEEKLQTLNKQLENLNLLDKGIVLLYLENKSYSEIADITGLSESNIGTKMSRIRNKLKNQILKQL